nr:hypothetical protein [Tanacetum cinerariifolium]
MGSRQRTFGRHRDGQCTARKKVKDSEWFKDKMLLAQAQEAGVILDEEQQDFLADSLEETDDCDDLQLQATVNFKTNHVDAYDLDCDAYDSDCDDEATTNAIIMENLSPVGSLNDDMVAPRENDAPSSSNDTSAIVVPPGYILTTTFVRKVLFPAVCQKVLYGAVCLIVSAVWIDIGLQSIDEGPFKMGNFKETLADGAQDSKQDRVFKDLTPEEKDRHKADVCATNILPQDFHQNKGEAIHEYHVRFTKLINDMRNIKMTMPKMQLNLKFVNNMLPKWGRFVTVVRRNRGLKTSNYDQMYAYLKQHEAHANENKMMLERYTQHDIDPLAFRLLQGQDVADASSKEWSGFG